MRFFQLVIKKLIKRKNHWLNSRGRKRLKQFCWFSHPSLWEFDVGLFVFGQCRRLKNMGQQPMFYLFFLLFILQYAIGFPHDATRVGKVGFRQDTPCGNRTQGNKIHTFFSSSSSFFNMKILPASNHSVLS